MHILLADNSYATECSALAFLLQEGYRVTYVHDGQAAVDTYLAESPDLVLMDVEVDGIEATRRIKALGGARWVPVILMTSLLAKHEMLAGFDAGADDYLIKPIVFEALDLRMRSMQRIATLMQDNLFGVLDNAHEAILTIDEAGIVQHYNKAMEQIFGYNAAEVIGANVKMLMPSPYAEEHDSLLARYVRERAPRFGIGRKVRGQRKNGEVFSMRLSVTDLRCNTGSQFVGLVIDLSDEEAARQRIEFLALHDSLTGLPNRACFKEALDTGCARSHEQPGAVLFIDLDGFKLINDSHGHAIGDLALITVAKRLRHNLAERDTVARLGGDEFVVLLAGPENATQGTAVAQRLLDSISRPMTLLGNTCHLCASIGIALIPAHGVTTNTVLSMADSAMYDAKLAGKGCIVVAGAERNRQGGRLNAHHAGQSGRDFS